MVATTKLPRIDGGASSSQPAALDIGALLGDTLQKLIGEKRASLGEALDKGGKIALDEFTDAVVPLGLAPAEVSLIFGHFDKAGTGFIDFEDLHKELTARVAERSSSGKKGGRSKAERGRVLEESSPFRAGDSTDFKPAVRPQKKGAVALQSFGGRIGMPR